jgi:hypothetical protein
VNGIDARWIEVGSGVFVDITTLRRGNGTMVDGDGEMIMTVKDGHRYRYDDIFPLRETEFEGVPALVPFAYPEILAEEYGEEALVGTYFGKHWFDEELGRWVPHLAPWLEEEG